MATLHIGPENQWQQIVAIRAAIAIPAIKWPADALLVPECGASQLPRT